jgi:hypothetical protein
VSEPMTLKRTVFSNWKRNIQYIRGRKAGKRNNNNNNNNNKKK